MGGATLGIGIGLAQARPKTVYIFIIFSKFLLVEFVVCRNMEMLDHPSSPAAPPEFGVKRVCVRERKRNFFFPFLSLVFCFTPD